MVSIAKYRKQLEQRVETIRASKNHAPRMAAFALAGGPAAPDAATAPREDALLATLASSDASASDRLNALGVLRALAFASPNAKKWRPRFIQALRQAREDKGVNLAALDTLIALGDDDTRARLLEGLRKPKKALVTNAQAFELLASDPHADAIAAARAAVDRADDAATVQAAIPHLARDPQSVDRLKEVIANRDAPHGHRRAATESLFALDQRSLASAAHQATKDSPKLRAFALGLVDAKPQAAAPPAKKRAGAKKKTAAKKARRSPKKKS